jgi:Uncharacterized protein conserved in bacteria (DUF2188)
MSHVTYKVVQHDGGWAYTVDGSFSETFKSHDAALTAARRAAREQKVAGETSDGRWHEELSEGDDRPDTEVTG